MLTLADIKPSLISVVTFAAMYLLVSNLLYIIFVTKVQVPGLTDLVKRSTGAV